MFNRKFRILIFLAVLLFSAFLIYNGSHTNPIVPFNNYVFELTIEPLEFRVFNFELVFDFDSQIGKLEFDLLEKGKNISSVELNTPSSIILYDYDILDEFGNSMKNDFEVSNATLYWVEKLPLIRFHEFNFPIGDYHFIMNFKSNKSTPIYPNGIFLIAIQSEEVRGVRVTPFRGTDNVIAKFDLGKYTCTSFPCINSLRNTEGVITDNQAVILFNRTRVNDFIISTIDGNKQSEKELKISFGISLFSGTFLLLIRELLYTSRDIRKVEEK